MTFAIAIIALGLAMLLAGGPRNLMLLFEDSLRWRRRVHLPELGSVQGLDSVSTVRDVTPLGSEAE